MAVQEKAHRKGRFRSLLHHQGSNNAQGSSKAESTDSPETLAHKAVEEGDIILLGRGFFNTAHTKDGKVHEFQYVPHLSS
jgi:hypothetical protein